ncbi:semaphorin-6A isoform X1 [Maylandia zebra]|uniref:Semaphorin-6A n=2 Tax=Haplochromini TaxID=319058 RepID=A0A9Y3RGC2_9CICH|nr:PREDICTED: semaphorin-6A isoform X1 [Pundamilia nyererei]XP_012773521.1 semaphorin-6A isoform X1 [Maylandia zebra]XP_026044097.1 semaphorin-6A isoform X1 [Astatotilapia calliptera]
MRSEALLLYFTLLQIAGAGFPEDSEPISISHGNYTKQYPAFVGHKPGRNNTQRHKLDIQLIMIMNRTLYIAARDHIYTVDTDTANSEEIFFSKKMTWKSRQGDVDTCRMKGKHKDECHNFIKVLLQQNEDTLFVCGTNAFNPSCRTYKIDTLEAQGEEISGMARCPYDAKHANVALFADGKLYSATVTDFLAIDAVIYRSLGDSPTLRTVKHDSKWLKEPYFVQAVNYGDFIYFFFREIAMEYNTMGKVVFPRVARVCKNDRGGSPRVLEKQWTSFLKSRLNCSIPGDSHFYFNILQAVTDVIHINGRDVVMATFSTPYNSIPGSAVCAYDMAEVANTFTGRFKEQKSPDSTWTPFPEEKVPKPRPGNCAGTPPMERYKVSNEFPDDTLNFIKMHPLMDEAVPSIANRPWFLKTMVRYRLTRIVVDNEAGPYKNHTVVFLGSEKGIILKFLAKMNNGFLNESLFLEELSVYNPDKCSIDGVEDKRIVGIQIDSKSHALWVAFTSCVVKVPLSRCERHGRCKKSCIASRDPYCGWVPEGACRQVVGNTKSAFEQDVEHGNTDGLGDCQNTFVALNDVPSSYEGHHHHRHHHTLSLPTSALPEAADGPLGRGRMVERKDPPMSSDKGEDPYMAVPSQTQPEANGVIRESYQKGRDQLVPVTLLAIAVILAFAMGAIFSGIIVYCVCDHRRRDMDLTGRKEKDTHHLHSRRGSMNSVTKLTGLFETQAKEGRPEAILTPLMHNGRLTPNGKMLIKADQHHLDLAALPTPESTPMQPRRKPSRGSREWERNQNLINACTKDMPPMGSPVISTDLPLRASPGHIPSVVVLPLQQHQHQLQPHLQQHQQSYQHEYVEQPHHSDMSMGHGVLDDQGATLEYKTSKSPCHNLNMADPDVVLPPRVPQREASLTIPPAVPQMGKRLEVHSSVYGLRKGSASGACGSSALKKHNTNSSNSSHLARHHSFNRVETPPPAPQRVDSIQMTAQGISLSRQPGMSSYGSLPRTGVKYLKPDVPPKPSVVSLSTKVKSSDSGT